VNVHSIRFRIAAVLVAAFLFFLVVEVFLVTPKREQARLAEAKRFQAELAAQTATQINLSFIRAKKELEMMAGLPSIVSLEKERMDATLALLDSVSSFFNYYFVMDAKGRWLSFPGRPDIVGKAIPQRNMRWVRQTFKEGGTVFLDVVRSRIDTLVTGFSTPVRGPSGPKALLRGVIVVSEDNALLETIRKIKAGENGYAFLVSSNGWLLAHPEKGLTAEDFLSYDYSSYEPVARVMRGEQGVTEYQYEGETWIAAYHPIPSTGWGVVVQQPKADVVALVNAESRIPVVSSAGAFALGAVLVSMVLGVALRPLSRLVQDVRERRPPEDTEATGARDEIGQLTREFHTLFAELSRSEEALREANEALERGVRERTAELKRANESLEHEIQEHLRVEAALSESEELYHSLFNQASDGILLLDATGPEGPTVVDANKAAVHMHGQRREDLIGLSVEDLAAPGSGQAIREKLALTTTEEPLTFEASFKRKGGPFFTAEISARRVSIGGSPYIQAIGRDVTERKRQEEALRKSLQEKEVLLREIHHRVKNNMQVILSLLRLESAHMRDDRDRDLFRESRNRIKAMVLIHEKLYHSPDLAEVDFDDYIRNLASSLYRSLEVDSNRVRVAIEAQGVMLAVDTAIPCGLLINELLVNALRHAFPDGRAGVVRIALRALGANRYELIFSDDGAGFPQSVHFENAQTLGLQLVGLLADTQLRGKVELLPAARGTTFRVTFGAVSYVQRL
jgi:PAS domain S-box-containing protein